MRRFVWLGIGLVLGLISLPADAAPPRPNVVLIYGDDVGYGDLGCYGAKLIPTPNLDRLAAQGLRFTDAHCTAATCSPSRFALLTGVHAFRHRVRVLPPGAGLVIPTDAFTLPRMFKRAGYHTAVVGKWHLGLGPRRGKLDWNGPIRPGPLELGFDYAFLLPSTNDRVPCVYVENHRVVGLEPQDPLFLGRQRPPVPCTEYPDGKKHPEAMTYYRSSHGHNNSVINGIGRIGYQWGGRQALWNDETMTDEFVRRIKRYIASRAGKGPFFLYFASQAIHVPRTPHPRFHGKSKLTYRGDAMVELDWAVGEILRTLDEHGLTRNTIVIFTSDNGPVYDDGYRDGTTVLTSTAEVDRGHDASGPYRGGKYQIYEGGTRVPFIIRWPGHIRPGTTSPALITQVGLLATFAELLGVELPPGQAEDSRSFLPALLGRDQRGLPFIVEEAGGVALRQGPWKYIPRTRRWKEQLYHLERDPGEQHNLLRQHPERAQAMKRLLQQIRQRPLRKL